MKICKFCESVMAKSTPSAGGNIVFKCRCQYMEDGAPDDSLMQEEYLETETMSSSLKHDVFIENSPYDAAGNIVLKDCLQCGLNFLTMIRIGTAETCMLVCSCGYKSSQDEYMRSVGTKAYKTNIGTRLPDGQSLG